MARVIQERMFDESIDSSLALAADKYVEALKELDECGKHLQKATGVLIMEMNKHEKLKVRHHGKVFEVVNTDPKQKIKVKDEGKKTKKNGKVEMVVRPHPEEPNNSIPEEKKTGKARNSKLKKNALKLHKK